MARLDEDDGPPPEIPIPPDERCWRCLFTAAEHHPRRGRLLCPHSSGVILSIDPIGRWGTLKTDRFNVSVRFRLRRDWQVPGAHAECKVDFRSKRAWGMRRPKR